MIILKVIDIVGSEFKLGIIRYKEDRCMKKTERPIAVAFENASIDAR